MSDLTSIYARRVAIVVDDIQKLSDEKKIRSEIIPKPGNPQSEIRCCRLTVDGSGGHFRRSLAAVDFQHHT